MSFPAANVALQGFTVFQPARGSALQFIPALGTAELDMLIDAYVVGPAAIQEKRATVSMQFYTHTAMTNESQLFFPVNMPVTTSPTPSLMDASFASSPVTPATPASTLSSASTQNRVSKSKAKPTRKPSVAAATTAPRASVHDFSSMPGMRILTKEGIDVTNSSRGGKSKQDREHAHLIRLLKSCPTCKRKKVRCDPSHKRDAPQIASEPKQAKKSQANAPAPVAKAAEAQPSYPEAPFQMDFEQMSPLDPYVMPFDTTLTDFNLEDFLAAEGNPLNLYNDYQYDFDSFQMDPADLGAFGFNNPIAFSPSNGSSTSPSSNSFTPISPSLSFMGPSPTITTPADTAGPANTEMPQLPFLYHDVHGPEYVDFTLYSPASSFLDEEPQSVRPQDPSPRRRDSPSPRRRDSPSPRRRDSPSLRHRGSPSLLATSVVEGTSSHDSYVSSPTHSSHLEQPGVTTVGRTRAQSSALQIDSSAIKHGLRRQDDDRISDSINPQSLDADCKGERIRQNDAIGQGDVLFDENTAERRRRPRQHLVNSDASAQAMVHSAAPRPVFRTNSIFSMTSTPASSSALAEAASNTGTHFTTQSRAPWPGFRTNAVFSVPPSSASSSALGEASAANSLPPDIPLSHVSSLPSTTSQCDSTKSRRISSATSSVTGSQHVLPGSPDGRYSSASGLEARRGLRATPLSSFQKAAVARARITTAVPSFVRHLGEADGLHASNAGETRSEKSKKRSKIQVKIFDAALPRPAPPRVHGEHANFDAGQQQAGPQQHTGPRQVLSSQTLAGHTGPADKTVKIWDAATGQEKQTLADHTEWVSSVASVKRLTEISSLAPQRLSKTGVQHVQQGRGVESLSRQERKDLPTPPTLNVKPTTSSPTVTGLRTLSPSTPGRSKALQSPLQPAARKAPSHQERNAAPVALRKLSTPRQRVQLCTSGKILSLQERDVAQVSDGQLCPVVDQVSHTWDNVMDILSTAMSLLTPLGLQRSGKDSLISSSPLSKLQCKESRRTPWNLVRLGALSVF